MIPREILKKIRQIEIRTNRLVSRLAVSVCPGRTNQSVFWSALTCILSPRRGFPLRAFLVCPEGHPTNPAEGYFKDAASIPPSPWGEGRDEGGRETSFFFTKNLLPVFQLLRFAARVENRENHNTLWLNQEVNHKRKTTKNDRASDLSSDFREPFGVTRDALKVLLDGGSKFAAQTFALAFVPGNGIVKFLFRDTSKDEAALHLRYFASSFFLASSHETTALGLLRWSWRRWSIKAASPGVSSFDSTMSFQRSRHNSICSASGSARASLKTISELMLLNLPAIPLLASA